MISNIDWSKEFSYRDFTTEGGGGGIFRGSFDLVNDLDLPVNATEEQIFSALETEIDNIKSNDYCFVYCTNTGTGTAEYYDVYRCSKDDGFLFQFRLKGIEILTEKPEPSGISYLCFTAEEANAPLEMAGLPGAPEMDLWYSYDKSNWTQFDIGVLDDSTFEVSTHGTVITLENIGDKVYFKGNNDHGFCVYDEEESSSYPNEFIIKEKKISVSGNIMTIMDETGENNTIYENNFDKLFLDCCKLTDASELELPAMELAPYCYSNMFANWSYDDYELIKAPKKLPATTLADNCYAYMFTDCTSLTTAPELPATTLADKCYYYMFDGCTSLTTAPELPATTLADSCYNYMFHNCTSLTTAPELPATTLADSCYADMFDGCTSLTTAPTLPATTLADSCYGTMFSDCTSLTTAPELPATTLAFGCYSSMFYGCTSLTTAPELPATTLTEYCYAYMFTDCTSLTTAPTLPATTLVDNCYNRMFERCTSLITAPELPATMLADSCYYGMFRNCTSLSSAPTLPATTLADSCYASMFEDCTSLDSIIVMFTSWEPMCTISWLRNTKSDGTFACPPSLPTTRGESYIPTGWMIVELPTSA